MLVRVRPLTGEPLPLDLLNTTWIANGERRDQLADEAGMRSWLDEHGFDAPSDASARRALLDTREALRALLLARGDGKARAQSDSAPAASDAHAAHAHARSKPAIEAVNAVLARGGRHPVLTPDGVEYEVVAANAWRVPWTCAAELVELLDQRGDRIRGCANPDCVLWFLDTTRPGTRRWCSMAACGNRDKAIRHGRVRRP
jgi:predicted RNA-binding Zn ribbon-like protein